MSLKKTAAELQIEYLKKLKAAAVKQSKPKPIKVVPDESVDKVAAPKKRQRAKKGKRSRAKSLTRDSLAGIKVDKALWKQVKSKNRKRKVFRAHGAMLDWALQLLAELPLEAGRLSEEGKQDFYRAARQWLRQRGVNDD